MFESRHRPWCTIQRMTTHDAGNLSLAMVNALLVKRYGYVLLPFGDGCRYDLAFDDGESIRRVQVKTGWMDGGAIAFNTSSNHYHRGEGRRDYQGEVDFFGVYCPITNEVYLVPIEDVAEANTNARLRVEPARNGQRKGIRWAKDYVLR